MKMDGGLDAIPELKSLTGDNSSLNSTRVSNTSANLGGA
jgi:hypothetical protein